MDLLELLSANKVISGQTMARMLDISRAAVHKRIQKLRRTGYRILGGQNSGYSLVSRPDLLLPEEIRFHLPNGVPAGDINYYTEADSTQSVAMELAARGAKEGTLVVAERQTGSYGRLGRIWISSKGGLWFSLIVRPGILPERAPQITSVMSLAICLTLERAFAVAPKIKWPNDIMLNERKFCGILTEMSAEVGRLNWAVIGVGINVNNELPRALENDAVALHSVQGYAIDRPRLMAGILADFHRYYGDFKAGGFPVLEKEYNRRSYLAGKEIRVRAGNESISGKVEKVDGEGYLWLRLASGKREKVMAGDVTVEK